MSGEIKLDPERENEELTKLLTAACNHIEWLLPYANARAAQSGNTAGLCLNATNAMRAGRAYIRTAASMRAIVHEREAEALVRALTPTDKREI